MAANLIEMFQNTVGDLLVKHTSGLLGESSDGTSAAVKAIVPSLLAAIIQKASTVDGASGLLSYMDEKNLDGTGLSNVSAMLTGDIETEKLMYSGAVVLRYLLNDKISPVADVISGTGGLKTSSSTSLLKLATPLLMSVLGKHVQEKGLDAMGLKTLLQEQKEYIKADIPAGIPATLGLNANLQPIVAGQNVKASHDKQKGNSSTFSRSLPWMVLLIAALGIYYFVQKGCEPAPEPEPVQVQTPPVDTAIPKPVEKENPVVTYTLPDGKTIHALPGSFTGKFAEFLAGTEKGDKCFLLDHVDFENNSFKIAAGSQVQLNHLATILKAYPDTKIQIEGHTDEEGDNNKNKNLSKERAKVIKTWLTEHGIEPGRTDVKGWGEEKPIASNKTKEGREKNRRIEICLSKK